MRIRSIKYKSGNKSSSHSELPQRGLFTSKIQAISIQNLQVYSNLHKQSTQVLKDNDNSKTLLTTLQCSNFKKDQPVETKRNNFFIQKSLDKNSKRNYTNQRQKNIFFDKENRSSYLMFKKSITSKSPQDSMLKFRTDMKTDKINLKVENFQLNQLQTIDKNEYTVEKEQKRQDSSQTVDQIILGQNLTYGIDILQKEIQNIEQATSKQKTKIDKIREQMGLLGPRIQAQLNDIIKNFKKGLQNLQSHLSRQKSQKFTQLVNWKNLISSKKAEYDDYFEAIDSLSERSQTLQILINNKGVQSQINQDHLE